MVLVRAALQVSPCHTQEDVGSFWEAAGLVFLSHLHFICHRKGLDSAALQHLQYLSPPEIK